ncbi:MAG: heme-binding protein [Chthoniobacterales bacterium]
MPKTLETLSLPDAKRMLAAGEAKAEQIGIPYNIAVVDAGGHLVAFSRQDGALIGSIDLAIQKAFTASIFDISTGISPSWLNQESRCTASTVATRVRLSYLGADFRFGGRAS